MTPSAKGTGDARENKQMWFQPRIQTTCECRSDFWRLGSISLFGLFFPITWFISCVMALFGDSPLPIKSDLAWQLSGSALLSLLAFRRIRHQMIALHDVPGAEPCCRLARKSLLVMVLFNQSIAWFLIYLMRWHLPGSYWPFIRPPCAAAFITSFLLTPFILRFSYASMDGRGKNHDHQ